MIANRLALLFQFKGTTFELSVCRTGEQRRKKQEFKEVADFTGF
jgi:hypothetical protein